MAFKSSGLIASATARPEGPVSIDVAAFERDVESLPLEQLIK